MPVITIQMTRQEYAKKAEIAKVFTDELSRITGIPKEPIVVLFRRGDAGREVRSGNEGEFARLTREDCTAAVRRNVWTDSSCERRKGGLWLSTS
jgi:phenylpyruvate tautomerase PptA (4-oxalocrotonate tautomerase family)